MPHAEDDADAGSPGEASDAFSSEASTPRDFEDLEKLKDVAESRGKEEDGTAPGRGGVAGAEGGKTLSGGPGTPDAREDGASTRQDARTQR